MVTRKRIKSTSTPSGGGGTVPTFGNVAWGPDFGEAAGNDGVSFGAGASMAFTAAAVFNTKTVGATITMPALAVAGSASAGAHLSGSVLGAPFWQSVTTSTTLTCNIPASVAVGDLLVAFVGTSALTAAGLQGINVPTGWTDIRLVQVLGTVASLGARAMYRIADGTEGASVTFVATGSPTATLSEIHRVNGTHATTPANVSASATLLAAALVTDPVSPTVTTTAANCLVFAYLNHYHAATSSTHTAPASHTERTDFQVTGATNTGATSDTRVFASAAATGTATHDCTETVATDAVMLRVAIAPGALVIAA